MSSTTLADALIGLSNSHSLLLSEAAQVDFGAGPTIVDVHTGEVMTTWIFVMTLAFSRHQYAEVVRDQTVATWLACHRRAFEHFGRVPERILIGNPQCVITRASVTDPHVQRAYARCAERSGLRISPCPPARCWVVSRWATRAVPRAAPGWPTRQAADAGLVGRLQGQIRERDGRTPALPSFNAIGALRPTQDGTRVHTSRR